MRFLHAALAPLVLAPLFMSTAAASTAADEPSEMSRVDRYMREHRESVGSPGVAYAVIRGDHVVHSETVGTDGDGKPMTANTPFLLGSVAKPITATAVLQLVEAGRVELDAPVVDRLGWFRLADKEVSDTITTRQLLTHTSGLSEQAGIELADRFDNSAGGLKQSVRDLAGVEPVGSPGAKPRYSSANYMVLGALVEEVTGESFGDYLREHVLRPLKMRDAIIDAEGAHDRLPPGHRLAFEQTWSFDTEYDMSGLPYGYLGASLEDMTHFAIAGINGGRYQGSEVLSADGVARMQTGSVESDFKSFGLGWKNKESDGMSTVFHSGATAGFMSTILLVPDEDLAIVVMHNAYSMARDSQMHEAAFNVARILRDHPPVSVGTDPLLAYLPWVLLAVAVIVLSLLVRSALRSRGRPVSPWSTGSWVVGAVLLTLGVGWLLPSSQGGGLPQVMLWTPAIAVGIFAVVAVCALAVVVQLVIALRQRRGVRRAP